MTGFPEISPDSLLENYAFARDFFIFRVAKNEGVT